MVGCIRARLGAGVTIKQFRTFVLTSKPLPLIQTVLRKFLRLTLAALPGCICFVLFFVADFLAEAFPILFYRGLIIAGLVFILHLFVLFFFFRDWPADTWIAAAVVAGAINVCFLVIFPVTIDRSITVYLLDQIARQDSGMTALEIEQRFIEQYVKDFNAIDRRMNEQVASKNIYYKDGNYIITEQGKSFLTVSNIIGDIFNTDKRLLPQNKVIDE